ncbi:Glycine receptor subunit alphaZ1-like protein, partial [Leptotrombidium deliense]
MHELKKQRLLRDFSKSNFCEKLTQSLREEKELYAKLSAKVLQLFRSFFAHTSTSIIDENYDRLIAPKKNGDPVFVSVSIFVLNIRSVRSRDLVNSLIQSFTADLFVHQYWIDERLKFPKGAEKSINLHGSYKEIIWIPDMYFKNGISGEITTHSFKTTYFVLYNNNKVFMASRVSVDLVCEMHFRKYPHDEHICDITLMSLVLRWKTFQLTARLFNTDYNISFVKNATCDKTYQIGTFSCVTGKFLLVRDSGNFFTKYVPSFTIVIASFVGFWIPTGSYPARASVVVTSMLALITQQLQTTSDIKTSYFVCINIWMNICTTIVFCCLLEFAFAIIWEQNKQKQIAKKSIETSEGDAPPEGRVKSVLKKFEKHNRNPVDQ